LEQSKNLKQLGFLHKGIAVLIRGNTVQPAIEEANQRGAEVPTFACGYYCFKISVAAS